VSPAGGTAEFPVVNRGEKPLTIGPLELGCACLDGDASMRELPPGETASISVRVRVERAGEKSTWVAVHSSDEQRPRVRLDVAWRGVAPLEFEPTSVDFGNVLPNSETVRTVRLLRRTNLGADATSRIIGWNCAPGADLAVAGGDDGVADVFTVRLRTDDELGDGKRMLLARVEGGGNTELELPVRWTVRDLIAVHPTRLSLGFGSAGQEQETMLLVTGVGPAPLEVTAATFCERLAWADATLKESTSFVTQVLVRARLPETPGEHLGELVIECASPEPRTLRVPVSAYVNVPHSQDDVPSQKEVSS
jgi:hypothetical protein